MSSLTDRSAILKDSESNDSLIHFIEFSNVHNGDRSLNATKSKIFKDARDCVHTMLAHFEKR